ncbi:hypothetical protein D3Z60_11570 [Lachnospiraceae bacterium]|nr:hypothetical protein [Lachnospiraceae bacterium]
MYHKKKYSSFLLMSVLMLLPLTGCSKDEILNQYNNVVQSAGNATLTGDLSLKGKRTYGDDHYTGTYVADYKDFSKTEYLFGGTSIERENGKDISVSCNLEITEGTAQVFWISGSDDPVVLLEASDGYSETLTLPEGGNYFGITGDNFTGHLEMNIE